MTAGTLEDSVGKCPRVPFVGDVATLQAVRRAGRGCHPFQYALSTRGTECAAHIVEALTSMDENADNPLISLGG